MKVHKTNYMMVLILLISFSIGLGAILEEYQYSSITGKAISEGFDIDEVDDAISPMAAALLKTNEHDMISSASEELLDKDNSYILLNPTSIPGEGDDHFLHLDFEKKVVILSLYMKNDGSDSSFEIWGPTRKVGEGSLTNKFRWYTFDVSFNEMSSDRYAVYNYGGGEGSIFIDTILGVPKPKSGLAEYLTGLAVHN